MPAALVNDQALLVPKTNLVWNGSNAQKLLQKDFDDKLTEDGRTPIQLYESRMEYQQFKLVVFRDHLYQIRRSKKGRTYWMYLKKPPPEANTEDNEQP
jgi:hypothetical protein